MISVLSAERGAAATHSAFVVFMGPPDRLFGRPDDDEQRKGE